MLWSLASQKRNTHNFQNLISKFSNEKKNKKEA